METISMTTTRKRSNRERTRTVPDSKSDAAAAPPEEARTMISIPDVPPLLASVDRGWPLRVLTLVRAGAEASALVGFEADDEHLLQHLMRSREPTDFGQLVAAAEAWGYAILVRTDLPRLL